MATQSENDELRNMLLSFRVSELQMLLGFAGRNKTGRKNELQQRALELLRVRSVPIQVRIRELYKSIQQSGVLNTAVGTPQVSPGNSDLGAPTLTPNMPQQPNGVPRATIHPYNPAQDGRQMSAGQPNQMYPAAAMYQRNHYYTQRPQQPNSMANSYPVHPDVRFKQLPFYDIITDLLKPASLVPTNSQRMQEGTFYFHLTPQQATDIATSRDMRPGSKCEFVKQVQMRFCLLETSCEQEDYFPPQLMVKVNSKLCPLPNPVPTNKPGVDPKRPPRPVNITALVKLSPTVANTIHVTWAAEYGRGYAITVALVNKCTSSDLLQRLKNKGSKPSEYSRGLIKEKLNEDADSEIATTSLRVSLMCPLGKMRMSTPCRANTCNHLQCFDASLFIQMNERKPTWLCPVCDKPALYNNLVIDGYFQEVLCSTKLCYETNEIQLNKDGSWSINVPEKKDCKPKIEKQPLDDSIEIISDDVECVSDQQPVQSAAVTSEAPKEPEKKDVVDLTLSDSDDDEPLAKRHAPAVKPDSTIKFSDTTSISSTTSSQSRLTTTPGPSSVSSSGYRSPSVITLDSPSPPRSPHVSQMPVPPSCMMASTNMSMSAPHPAPMFSPGSIPPYLDIETDPNVANIYPRY